MTQYGKPLRTALVGALRRIPMPVLAIGIGLCAGLAVWAVLDQLQGRSVDRIVQRELRVQLDQRSREHLVRFDQYLQNYATTVRLLANHRRLAKYLESQFWLPEEEASPTPIDLEHHPAWLPAHGEWGALIEPPLVLLTDRGGGVRELYSPTRRPLPHELQGHIGRQYLAETEVRTVLTRLDGSPTLLVSDAVEDASGYPMGYLVILVPVNDQFLADSQSGMSLSSAVLALVDADDLRVLVSSGADPSLDGTEVDQWRGDYQITFRSLSQYEGTDWNVMFATFVPHDVVATLARRVGQFEERHRVITALAFILVFTLLIYLVSARLNRVITRMARFARRALGIAPMSTDASGNQLLLLEEWIGQFGRLVLRNRNEMQHRHANEMRQSEALKMAVLEAARDGIITIDEGGGILECNHTAERLFGFERTQVVGRRLTELLIAPEDREEFEVLWRAVRIPGQENRNHQPARSELTALRSDSQRVQVEVSIVPILFGDQHLYTIYLHDISERLKAEREIKSLARFASESPNPTLRVTRQGAVVYANAASLPLMAYWGCKRGQTLPIYWRDQITRALDENHDLEYQLDCDGQFYALVLAPVRDLDYVNLYGRDVTAERRAEQEARQHQAELVHVCRLSTLGEVATGMAHELNQPLAAIANYANGCSRRIQSGTAARKELLVAMRQITKQAERASEIIRRLRALVGKQPPTRSVADLNHLVREVCSFVEYECSRLGVGIGLDLYPAPLWVDVDLVQIEQVLLNLVGNALDALEAVEPSRRKLRIRSAPTQSGVRVTVADTGTGIPAEQIEQLFEPFFTTKDSGMGMGLPISLTIVQDHGGRIWATSEPGSGTLFHVELPCAEAPGWPEQTQRALP